MAATAEDQLRLVARGVKQVTGEMLLDDRFDERMNIRLKPGFDTACWSFQPPHAVYIGTDLFKRTKPRLNEEQKLRYVGRYAHHERAHAMYTERSSTKTETLLAKHGVAFPLYNLVEDARIEARYVKESEGAFRFDWLDFEELQANSVKAGTAQPQNVFSCAFFNCIQSEGDFQRLRPLYPMHLQPAVEVAVGFYEEAVACDTSAEAIELCVRILAKYPFLNEMRSRCSSLALGLGMQGRKGVKAKEAFETDTKTPEQASKGDDRKSKTPGVANSGSPIGTDLLASEPEVELDERRIVALANRLMAMRVQKTATAEATSRPGTRVSVRHLLQGQARWAGISPDPAPAAVRNILLVVDISGSMDGTPIEEARYLVAALSELARRGVVRGTVVLSTTGADAEGVHCRKALPWSTYDCSRITTDDAEGLADTLKAHDALLEEADLTLVVTDGNINGAPIPHQAYKRRGKTVLGVYVRDEDRSLEEIIQHMSKHFQKMLVRSTLEALVEAIALQPA
jgi:hypothetical protein